MPSDEQANESPQKDMEAVYAERNLLACALAQATDAPSGWKPDPDLSDEWAIVWVETPVGEISWHVPRDMADELAGAKQDTDYDGYSRAIKNDRLVSWVSGGCWSDV